MNRQSEIPLPRKVEFYPWVLFFDVRGSYDLYYRDHDDNLIWKEFGTQASATSFVMELMLDTEFGES